MKKILFAFLLSFSLSLSAAPESGYAPKYDDDDVIEIDVNYMPPVTGPKRTPAVIPIFASYYVSLGYIEVSFLYNIGDVDITITNHTTNSTIIYNNQPSTSFVIIPLELSSGYYSIDFILSDDITYSGFFIV